MMKLLLLTDIHADFLAAENACRAEKPDFVLDCGDHKEIRNISELVPHLYVRGNHEPFEVCVNNDGYPLPFEIKAGVVAVLKKGELEVKVAGIGGNYTNPGRPNRVEEYSVEALKSIPENGADIFLTHESPLLVGNDSNHRVLAQRVIAEIDRIKPKLVFSGHYTRFNNRIRTPGEVCNIVLDDVGRGYCLVDGDSFNVERKILRYR